MLCPDSNSCSTPRDETAASTNARFDDALGDTYMTGSLVSSNNMVPDTYSTMSIRNSLPPWPLGQTYSQGSTATSSSYASTPCDLNVDHDLHMASLTEFPFENDQISSSLLGSVAFRDFESMNFASALDTAVGIDPSLITMDTTTKGTLASGISADKELAALEALKDSLQDVLPLASWAQRGTGASSKLRSAFSSIAEAPTPGPTRSTTISMRTVQQRDTQSNAAQRYSAPVTGWIPSTGEEYPVANIVTESPAKEITDNIREMGGMMIVEHFGNVIPPSRLTNRQKSYNSYLSSKRKKAERKSTSTCGSVASISNGNKVKKVGTPMQVPRPVPTAAQDYFSLVPQSASNDLRTVTKFPGVRRLIMAPAANFLKPAPVVRSHSRPNLHTLLRPHAARAITQRHLQAQEDERARLKAAQQTNVATLQDSADDSTRKEDRLLSVSHSPSDGIKNHTIPSCAVSNLETLKERKGDAAAVQDHSFAFEKPTDMKITLPSLASILGDYFSYKCGQTEALNFGHDTSRSSESPRPVLSRASSAASTAVGSLSSPTGSHTGDAIENSGSERRFSAPICSVEGPLVPNPDLLFGNWKSLPKTGDASAFNRSTSAKYPLSKNSVHFLCSNTGGNKRPAQKEEEEEELEEEEEEEEESMQEARSKRPRLEN